MTPEGRSGLPENYSRLAGMSDAAVLDATGRDWAGWTRYLDEHDAVGLEHPDIVALAAADGASDWWSQTITVAYERFRGLRESG